MSKPYSREALARKIRHVLRNRQQRDVSNAVLAARLRVAEAPHAAVAPRVLLVEDDELVRAGTAEMLRSLDIRTVEAGSGAQALEALSRQAVDVLFVDEGLPDMSGIDLAIDASRRQSRLRVVIASGGDIVLSAAQRAALPRVAILRKPFGF